MSRCPMRRQSRRLSRRARVSLLLRIIPRLPRALFVYALTVSRSTASTHTSWTDSSKTHATAETTNMVEASKTAHNFLSRLPIQSRMSLGREKLGYRISFWSSFQGMWMSHTVPQFSYLVEKLTAETGVSHVTEPQVMNNVNIERTEGIEFALNIGASLLRSRLLGDILWRMQSTLLTRTRPIVTSRSCLADTSWRTLICRSAFNTAFP